MTPVAVSTNGGTLGTPKVAVMVFFINLLGRVISDLHWVFETDDKAF